jgi:23S rRNA pseudouridine2457 synthase
MAARTAERQFSYFLFYKPYGVLSQFTSEGGRKSLKDYGPFPSDVYPAGRLDATSEGLLLITNDNRLKHRLTEPRFRHPRTYLVQVERVPNEDALRRLREGVTIEGKITQRAEIQLLDGEPSLPPRPVPVRFRKNVPTAWLSVSLREGRNRQIRKMTASVGYPTLRLVRTAIGELTLEGLAPGGMRPLTEEEVGRLVQRTSGSLADAPEDS